MRKNKFISYKIFMTLLICVIMVTCVRMVTFSQTYQEPEALVIIGEVYENETFGNVSDVLITAGIADMLYLDILPAKLAAYDSEIAVNNLENNVSESETISNYVEETNNTEISNTYSDNEIYELAKIIMCEAEGESQKCKEYIGQVVLNRVNSDKFPDTIHDVIFQKVNGKSQFSPVYNGRWESEEPTQECYDAAYTVLNASEPLTEALYFESCKGESWHSRNLTQIAHIDNTRFYI